MSKEQERVDKHYQVMHLGWLLGDAKMGKHITAEEFKWLVDEASREFIEELGYRKPPDRPELKYMVLSNGEWVEPSEELKDTIKSIDKALIDKHKDKPLDTVVISKDLAEKIYENSS